MQSWQIPVAISVINALLAVGTTMVMVSGKWYLAPLVALSIIAVAVAAHTAYLRGRTDVYRERDDQAYR